MANCMKALGARSLCLALASCATQVSVGLMPGNYSMTVKADLPSPHPACIALAGNGTLTFKDGTAITSLISPLQLIVDANGAVSGSGVEGMTGYQGVAKLIGKRTASGYEGTIVATAYSVDCRGNWVITRQDEPRR